MVNLNFSNDSKTGIAVRKSVKSSNGWIGMNDTLSYRLTRLALILMDYGRSKFKTSRYFLRDLSIAVSFVVYNLAFYLNLSQRLMTLTGENAMFLFVASIRTVFQGMLWYSCVTRIPRMRRLCQDIHQQQARVSPKDKMRLVGFLQLLMLVFPTVYGVIAVSCSFGAKFVIWRCTRSIRKILQKSDAMRCKCS